MRIVKRLVFEVRQRCKVSLGVNNISAELTVISRLPDRVSLIISRVYIPQKVFCRLGEMLQRVQSPILVPEKIIPQRQYPSAWEKYTMQTTESIMSRGHNG